MRISGSGWARKISPSRLRLAKMSTSPVARPVIPSASNAEPPHTIKWNSPFPFLESSSPVSLSALSSLSELSFIWNYRKNTLNGCFCNPNFTSVGSVRSILHFRIGGIGLRIS